MVLGVCALGVSALYLVPGLASPHHVAVPAPASEVPMAQAGGTPQTSGPDRASVAARSAPGARTASKQISSAPDAADRAESAVERGQSDAPPSIGPADGPATEATAPPAAPRGSGDRPRSSATPQDPGTSVDANPPEPVTELAARSVDPERLELGWAPSQDDVGIVGYRVWLNGYEVKTTSDTEVTLDWFNDDNTQQVVVVRAVDSAGNQSRSPATLLLTRPDPPAAPTDPATAPATPAPATEPSTPVATSTPQPSTGADRSR